jgi:ElaB/YqjD/DUF883 family membrane-anchored ribosome-binding protein
MGVLIVLLVIVVKHADSSATNTAQEHNESLKLQNEALEISINNSRVREGLLSELRDEVRSDLQNRQQVRSDIQQNINDLRRQAEMLSERFTRMANLADEDTSFVQDEAQKRLNELKQQIAAAETALEAASKLPAAPATKSYSIIPYHGSGQTDRQPIYIECTAEAVILQPYGIQLTAEDFAPPLMPGNPLDAALLTIRDRLHSKSGGNIQAQPYPLFVVRPEGAASYATCRSAMKSWVDQFGYELVPEEYQLEYPKGDDSVKSEIEQSIAAARIRLQSFKQVTQQRSIALSEIASNRFGARTEQSSNGGLPGAQGNASSSVAANPLRRTETNTSATGKVSNRLPETGPADMATATGASGSGKETNAARNPSSTEQDPTRLDKNSGEYWNSLDKNNSQSATQKSQIQQTPYGSERSFPNDPTAFDAANGSDTATAGSESAENNQRDFLVPGTKQASSKQASSVDANHRAAGGNSADASANMPALIKSSNRSSRAPPAGSLASKRGEDWALPNKSENATVFRRQIFMTCNEQELILNATRNSGPEQRVPLTESTEYHIDEMIDLVWKRVEQWGAAAPRSYWKPQLMIEVQPGGNERASEIQSLLERSGLDVLLIK